MSVYEVFKAVRRSNVSNEEIKIQLLHFVCEHKKIKTSLSVFQIKKFHYIILKYIKWCFKYLKKIIHDYDRETGNWIHSTEEKLISSLKDWRGGNLDYIISKPVT